MLVKYSLFYILEKNMMDHRIRKFYQLKKIYRINSVGNRKESSAEHCWSCLILADFFLNTMPKKLDRLKVYELLIYHDLVEIEAGDTPINHNRKHKRETELKAMIRLKDQIPAEFEQKFTKLFTEFEAQKTVEAKFAKAIDKLDATIHELDYKKDWKGWTEEMIRKYNEPYFKEFPEMRKFHEELLEFVKENDYFE